MKYNTEDEIMNFLTDKNEPEISLKTDIRTVIAIP